MAATAVPPTVINTHEPATGVGALPVATPLPIPQTDVVGAPEAGGEFANLSLYVGDLDPTVEDIQLYDLFKEVGHVVSVRVCRDQINKSSLGYAYVNFGNPTDAANAREMLNFTPVNGKPIRIMFSQRDPTIRKSGHANVFIKNLDSSIDNKALHDTFSVFGTILSCKLAVDSNGQSKGYGFVQFDQEEAAQNAINRLNGMLINDKQVHVSLFVRRQDRLQSSGSSVFTNVYVKNLPETTSDQELKNTFGKYGSITSAIVMKDLNGKSKCFGFVNFEKPDAANRAIEHLNGISLGEKVLYVGKAQKKAEREAELKAKFEQERVGRYEKLQGANLYLKNLDDSINEEKLKELFSPFGTITSCKVLVDRQGISMGAGFVAFSNVEQATKALKEMNGKMIGGKPLYVAVAQRKEERRARLQEYFAHVRAPTPMGSLHAGMPGFPPVAPRIAPTQMYFGQGSPGLLPSQTGAFGFQPHLLPGIRPGFGPNFLVPYPQIPRQGQRFGARRTGNPQQQWMPRNPSQGLSRYIANGSGVDPSILPHQGMVGAMMPLPLDVNGMPIPSREVRRSNPVGASSLASALASASPENQRMILGEHLFPLVESLEREFAGKITGMLLEMDQTEVLHLIESPDALKKKVSEAMNVLRLASSDSDAGDKFGSLSLGD